MLQNLYCKAPRRSGLKDDVSPGRRLPARTQEDNTNTCFLERILIKKNQKNQKAHFVGKYSSVKYLSNSTLGNHIAHMGGVTQGGK